MCARFACPRPLPSASVPATVLAASIQWQRYVIPSTGTNVEIPVTIFSKDAELPDGGTGRRFYTDDRRADLTVQSVANPENNSPATFLAKKNPPPGIIYKRVTPNFFVVSSIRNDRIWYNRCNRSDGYMNCVLINYPAAEKRQWDGVVTRISHTLANYIHKPSIAKFQREKLAIEFLQGGTPDAALRCSWSPSVTTRPFCEPQTLPRSFRLAARIDRGARTPDLRARAAGAV